MKKLLLISLMIAIGTFIQAQEPEWLWVTRAGGTSYDFGNDISTDSDGNIYVVGSFRSTAYFGNYSLTSSGWTDAFVAKLDATGNWLWARRSGGISGTNADNAYGVNTDSSGNVYVAGYNYDTASFGTIILPGNGGFIAKLDPDGNWLWAKRAGVQPSDVGFDSSGNCYIAGDFSYTANFGTTTLTSNGEMDVFVAKLDTNGNWLWATRAGGSIGDYCTDIDVDSSGAICITGQFEGASTFGTTTLTSSGEYDIYVASLDNNGNWLWVKQAGGTDYDFSTSITTDNQGNCYAIGGFNGSAAFGITTLVSSGESDIYIASLDENGHWIWATRAGGTSSDNGSGIAVDGSGNSFVTGSFSGDGDFGSTTLTCNGNYDIFVTKLDANGNWLWASRAGGSNEDYGSSVITNADGSSYITGNFNDSAGFGSYSVTSAGLDDIFVAKLGPEVGIDDEITPEIAALSCLHSAYPNPFHSGQTTTIKSDIGKGETGNLTIYNLKGQKIAGYKLDSGSYEISFDGKSLASGVYLYRLKTQSADTVKKLVLLK